MQPATSSLNLHYLWGGHKGCCLPCGFELNFVDHFACLNWANLCRFQLPPLLTLLRQGIEKYSGYVPLNSFQCDHASWWLHASVVPSHGVVMGTSLQGLNLPRLPINLFPSSSHAHLMAMSDYSPFSSVIYSMSKMLPPPMIKRYSKSSQPVWFYKDENRSKNNF